MYKSDCQDTDGNRIYTGRERLDNAEVSHQSAAQERLHTADHAERIDHVKRLVRENIHDQGRSAPLTNVRFRDIFKFNPMREV